MKNRSESREIIMKVLYQTYILDDTKMTYSLESLIKEQTEVQNEFIEESVKGVLENQKHIDDIANKYLDNASWKINRLNKVDKAIISIGVYELLYTETPAVVAINEAIELSKRYSDEKVTKMINAVLDNVYHNEVE